MDKMFGNIVNTTEEVAKSVEGAFTGTTGATSTNDSNENKILDKDNENEILDNVENEINLDKEMENEVKNIEDDELNNVMAEDMKEDELTNDIIHENTSDMQSEYKKDMKNLATTLDELASSFDKAHEKINVVAAMVNNIAKTGGRIKGGRTRGRTRGRKTRSKRQRRTRRI